MVLRGERGGRRWGGDVLEGEGNVLWIRVKGIGGVAVDENDVLLVWREGLLGG